MPTINVTREVLKYPLKYHNYHKAVTSKFNGFSQKGETVSLFYDVSLTEAEVLAINTAEANFVDNDPFQYILDNVLLPARAFGQKCIDDFAAENVMLGITQAGKTGFVRKACREVSDALATGSLYDAITETRALTSEQKDPVFLSDARLLSLINKIEKYLKLPISTAV
jgi:hypothetical protein